MWQIAHDSWEGNMTDPYGRNWQPSDDDIAEEQERQERIREAAEKLIECCDGIDEMLEAVAIAYCDEVN